MNKSRRSPHTFVFAITMLVAFSSRSPAQVKVLISRWLLSPLSGTSAPIREEHWHHSHHDAGSSFWNVQYPGDRTYRRAHMTESLALIPSAAESQLNRNAAFEELRDIVVVLYLGIGEQRNRKLAKGFRRP
jgi:hypothetical protein